MATLYVTSSEKAAGKTMLCAGLGRHLLSKGKKVGFLKLFISNGKPPENADSDAIFMKQTLALEEPLNSLCPVISDQGNMTSSIKKAYAKVSKDKDVVIVEGAGLDKISHTIVEALGSRVIIMQGYSHQSPKAELINSYKDFGEYLLGVVVNKVPVTRLRKINEAASARFGEAGINLLGVFPEDRSLFALTVAELAQHIQGEIISSAEKSAELIENFMLGARLVDPAPEYFIRKANKAVVVRSERPDMQLAALETPTKCLVLSGDILPISAVLYGAEVKNIPIISTKANIVSIVTSIEDGLDKTRFNQDGKLTRLADIMEKNFNFQASYKGLGLEIR